MEDLKKLKYEVIARIMMRHGYTLEEAETVWEQYKLHLSARRLLGSEKKDIYLN
jgi:hypothetical protein